MRVATTDPMTGNDVKDLDQAPFMTEGSGEDALKIYFEPEDSRRENLEFSGAAADGSLIDVHNAIRDKETMGIIN